MKIYLFSIVVISALSIGCSKKELQLSNLDALKIDYMELKKDKRVEEIAPEEIYQAGKIYALSRDIKEQKELEHLTFIFSKQLDIVKERVRIKELEDDIALLESSKQMAILDKKNQEDLLNQKREIALIKKREQEELKQLFIELNKESIDGGYILTLDNSTFDNESLNLLPKYSDMLGVLANYLIENLEYHVFIDGYAKSSKGEIASIDISLRVANIVGDILIESGVEQDRISINGHGNSYKDGKIADLDTTLDTKIVKIKLLKIGL